jgi:hypothetical protein
MPGIRSNIQNSKQVLDYLDTIGSSDRGDGVSLGNCAAALVDLGAFLIETATNNLDKNANTATGKTISSMKARDIQVHGTQFELDIEILSTYKFLNDGVQGVNGGSGKYKFKTLKVSKKHALAMLKWIKVRRVATKYKAISANERKNKKIQKASSKADSQKALAYAIATAIKKKGIRPTKFFTKAIEATKKEQKKKYANAFKLDIIETINKN